MGGRIFISSRVFVLLILSHLFFFILTQVNFMVKCTLPVISTVRERKRNVQDTLLHGSFPVFSAQFQTCIFSFRTKEISHTFKNFTKISLLIPESTKIVWSVYKNRLSHDFLLILSFSITPEYDYTMLSCYKN